MIFGIKEKSIILTPKIPVTGFVVQGHMLFLIQMIIFVFKHQIEWKLNRLQNKCINHSLKYYIDIYTFI